MSNRKSGGARARTLARKLAMQALYQWQLNSQPAAALTEQFHDSEEWNSADQKYFEELVKECIDQHDALRQVLGEFVDRPLEQLDPVEFAILLIGFYELLHRVEIPYRVVINEAVDLCKRFGAAEAHKYVNAVLDRAARARRPEI